MDHLQLSGEEGESLDLPLATLEYINPTERLENFLDKVDILYSDGVSKITMFDISQTCLWTTKQKQLFARLFYHARGHFYKFLWLVGSRSKSLATKEKVLENIQEEFGGEASSPSHEQMYLEFAKDLGVNLEKEAYEEEYYLPFLKKFDRSHVKAIVNANTEEGLVALLSAYERLDNIDYKNLLNLAKSIGVTSQEALLFFVVHSNAGHFNKLEAMLEKIWESNKQLVVDAFQFIYAHQMNLWKKLSDAVNKE